MPVVAVLVTHWHYDHLFGLAGFADVPTYAHETVADLARAARSAVRSPPGWGSSSTALVAADARRSRSPG